MFVDSWEGIAYAMPVLRCVSNRWELISTLLSTRTKATCSVLPKGESPRIMLQGNDMILPSNGPGAVRSVNQVQKCDWSVRELLRASFKPISVSSRNLGVLVCYFRHHALELVCAGALILDITPCIVYAAILFRCHSLRHVYPAMLCQVSWLGTCVLCYFRYHTLRHVYAWKMYAASRLGTCV